MPRDKKIVHRSTSDVEETSDTEDAISDPENERLIGKPDQKPKLGETNLEKLEEERKKILKDALLKRTIALKEQRTKKNKT
jgi:hypothetical protein